MNETTGKKTVVLFIVSDRRWIKDQIVKNFSFLNAVKGDDAGHYDDNKGY